MSKKTRKRLLILALICGLVPVVRLAPRQSVAGLIRDGSYGHSRLAGWVNWSHARPRGPAAFLRSLRAAWQTAIDPARPFRVSYGQSMSGKLMNGVWLSSSYRADYEVAAGLSARELDLVAWSIFREVSMAFEDMQGSMPSVLDIRSSDSAYRAGDLMGNRLAFHAALHDLSMEEVRELVQADSAEQSLATYASQPPPRVRTWEAPDTLPPQLRDLDAELPEVAGKFVRIGEDQSLWDVSSAGPS